jgi:hypothetical protein
MVLHEAQAMDPQARAGEDADSSAQALPARHSGRRDDGSPASKRHFFITNLGESIKVKLGKEDNTRGCLTEVLVALAIPDRDVAEGHDQRRLLRACPTTTATLTRSRRIAILLEHRIGVPEIARRGDAELLAVHGRAAGATSLGVCPRSHGGIHGWLGRISLRWTWGCRHGPG